MSGNNGVKGRQPMGGQRLPGEELPGEVITSKIVAALNKLELTADQSERICVVASARARHAGPGRIVRADHILALLEGAWLSTDEAKLIGWRAIRRARHIEDSKGAKP